MSLFLCSFFGAHLLFHGTGLGGGRRGAYNVPPPRGLRTGKPGKMYAAMIYIGRMRVRINKNKKHILQLSVSRLRSRRLFPWPNTIEYLGFLPPPPGRQRND